MSSSSEGVAYPAPDGGKSPSQPVQEPGYWGKDVHAPQMQVWISTVAGVAEQKGKCTRAMCDLELLIEAVARLGLINNAVEYRSNAGQRHGIMTAVRNTKKNWT